MGEDGAIEDDHTFQEEDVVGDNAIGHHRQAPGENNRVGDDCSSRSGHTLRGWREVGGAEGVGQKGGTEGVGKKGGAEEERRMYQYFY